MKLTIVLLTACILQASAKGYGQQVTFSGTNVPLEKVFSVIESQTGYVVFYNYSAIKEARTVTVNAKAMPLEQFLQDCFKDQPYQYVIEGKTISITKKPTSPAIASADEGGTKQSPPVDIKGKVINELGEPVVVSITVKGTTLGTTSNADGYFELKGLDPSSSLLISSISIIPFEIKTSTILTLMASSGGIATITAKIKIPIGQNVTITGNTGYQLIDKKHPGSFDVVSNELLNRKVSTNILDRIENLTTGLSFGTPNETTPTNPSGIIIRGRNSIFSDVAPLIVIDNFPYDGNLSNINPNDVESITILKDAATAAQWGARAGNGVIVITTKKGKSLKPQVTFNSNVTFQKSPDLFNINSISAADYIELEKYLFTNGYYANDETNNATGNGHPIFTPVVELLIAKRNGTISPQTADAQIEAMKNFDGRNDVGKYLYRNSARTQNALSVSGLAGVASYYMSAGWDKNISNLVGQDYDRITLRTQNTFKVSSRFQIDAGINYAQSTSKSGNNPGYSINNGTKGLYPYARLVNDNGSPISLIRDFRSIWTDTVNNAYQNKLLDWKYNPILDIGNTENQTKVRDFLINTGFRYRINNFFNAEVKYQYGNSLFTNSSLNKFESYSTRILINRFFQPGATNEFPIPKGGILDIRNSENISHQGRIQVNYNQTFNTKHQINAIAGWEIKDLSTKGNNNRIYGFQERGSQVFTNMDFVTRFKLFDNQFSQGQISNPQGVTELLDRFVSYYANATYNFDNRYIVTLSGRSDAANLFGVNANQKGVPLWSAGLGWQINNEKFYHVQFLPVLKLRASYGYNGNFSRKTSAFATIQYTNNSFGLSSARIINPPNKDLRWEQDGIINLGLDFATKNNRVFGKIEYYRKSNKDLMAQSPVDPTTGLTPTFGGDALFFGNTANIKGHGFEIDISSINILSKSFTWQTNLLFSYAQTKVTKYLLQIPANSSSYLATQNIISPIVGKPIYVLYSYAWAGLDPNTGDPRGYLGKDISKDYNSITNLTKVDSLIYNGPTQPPYFGALRNSFKWKNVTLSFNVSYKMGYSFKRNSLSYSSLFFNWTGSGDYASRWKKPGDEVYTNVPSLIYPANSAREAFYLNSEILIEKADQIRLEDIQLEYSVSKNNWTKLPFQQIRFYAYASNLGLLWKANKAGIDPLYNNNVPKERKSISFGMNINF